MPRSARDGRRRVAPRSRREWRDWLAEHHPGPDGAWVVLQKSPRAGHGLTQEEATLEALCFGWIDSTTNPLNARRRLVWFSPRRRGGTWSRSNKERLARLTEAGLMAPAGLAAVAAAQEDGSWSLLDDVEALRVPPDLAAALAAHVGAHDTFAALAPSRRKQLLWWVVSAKRPATRADRVARVADAVARGSIRTLVL